MPLSPTCRKRTACWLGISLSVLALLGVAAGVKDQDFKTCAQSGFCNRNRQYADDAAALGEAWASPYRLDPATAEFSQGQLRAIVLKTVDPGRPEQVRLPLTVSFHRSGTARVTMDEERRQKGEIELRHGSTARKERYNETADYVLVGGLELDPAAAVASRDGSQITIRYGPEAGFEAVIRFAPLELDFGRGEGGDAKAAAVPHVRLNGRGLLNVDHWRPKVDSPPPPSPPLPPTPEPGPEPDTTAEAADRPDTATANENEAKDGQQPQEEADAEEEADEPGPDESTWWEETFRGNTDSKPRGPESVALDISFPGYAHVYGIPSHAGPLSLRDTRGGPDDKDKYRDPYRLYNLDVFEFIVDSPMTLYGSIPFMHAHRKDSSVAVFWLNAAETWIDITRPDDRTATHTHWISESGLLDVFVLLGPSPPDLTRLYGELTGYTALPQEFALGYHQCRWNYVSDEDVREVDRRMDRHRLPYDVIWLDIEYTDDKKYFTWHPDAFPDPVGMGRQLDARGRKLVAIIDPHIKNVAGYAVSDALRDRGLAVRNKDGAPFDGWCWPGSSHWVDTFSPAAREWWRGLFRYDSFAGTLENTFVWNDMNEPSVFNGPESTMPKDNLHHAGWEHRDVHNLMGMTLHNATAEALLSRRPGELRRPFVLTRAFFAGSQRAGAMWTGDNQASWEHLAVSIPMVLTQGVAGFPFAGADVGGFFGNPDRELLARWYQAAVFYPFMRAHAHIDSRRREPYLLGGAASVEAAAVAAALRLRYTLLPTLYTAFFHASTDGSPIVRPMYWTHPAEEAGFDIDDQFFVGGSGILAKPVVDGGATGVEMWIPDGETYYDYFTYEPVVSARPNSRVRVEAPLDQARIPVLMRGGHVFARRDRPRRSSQLMRWDDYTLVVVVSGDRTAGAEPAAEGVLYTDDGDSFDHTAGQYIYRRFTLVDGVLRSADAEGRKRLDEKEEGEWLRAMRAVKIDRVVVIGAPAAWADLGQVSVVVGGDDGRTWTRRVEYHAATKARGAHAVISGLGAGVNEDWSVKFA